MSLAEEELPFLLSSGDDTGRHRRFPKFGGHLLSHTYVEYPT